MPAGSKWSSHSVAARIPGRPSTGWQGCVRPAVARQRLQFGDHRQDSAIQQQKSHAVVSGLCALFPPDRSRDRGRIDRERYLATNPEIEAEIATLYQSPASSPILAALPKPCATTLATDEIKMQ